MAHLEDRKVRGRRNRTDDGLTQDAEVDRPSEQAGAKFGKNLAKQLHDIKDGSRTSPTMMPFVNMLDDQKIADVAAYYSQLEPTAGEGGQKADDALLTRGEQLAQRGDWSQYVVSCKSCHGPGNQGAGDVFPGIAGQHAGYIEAQLKAWKEGTRKNDPQDLMGSIARRMSDTDIHAVAVWLANQNTASN